MSLEDVREVFLEALSICDTLDIIQLVVKRRVSSCGATCDVAAIFKNTLERMPKELMGGGKNS
jgi:hypothetical protein